MGAECPEHPGNTGMANGCVRDARRRGNGGFEISLSELSAGKSCRGDGARPVHVGAKRCQAAMGVRFRRAPFAEGEVRGEGETVQLGLAVERFEPYRPSHSALRPVKRFLRMAE
jgi:hypothetical protein